MTTRPRSKRLLMGPAAHGRKKTGCAVVLLASGGGLIGLLSIGVGFLFGAVAG